MGQSVWQLALRDGPFELHHLSVRRRGRFVAHHRKAGFKGREGYRQVKMIWRDDGNKVDRIGPLLLCGKHLAIVCIGPVAIDAIGFAGCTRALCCLRKSTGYKLDATIQFGGHAMNRTDESSGTAPDHPHSQLAPLRHDLYLSLALDGKCKIIP